MNTTVAERSARWRRRETSSAPVIGSRPGRRLVEEEDVRIGEQLDGDAGALALPAAERADPDVGLLGEADGVDRVARPPRRPRSRSSTTGAAAARRTGACAGAAARRGRCRPAARTRARRGTSPRLACRSTPSKRTDPEVDGRDPGDRLEQRRLPGSARTDDRNQLAGGNGERRGVEQRQLAAVADPDPPGQLDDVDADAVATGTGRSPGRRIRPCLP